MIGHDRVDDREAGDDQVGRAGGVGALHEVGADDGADDQGGQACERQPVEVAVLDALDDHLGQRRDEAVDDAGGGDVEERAHALAQPDPQPGEHERDDDQQHQDRDQLAVRHRLLRREQRRDGDEDEDAADARADRDERALASGLCPLICAFSSVVMTSATAPSGCTTMSGAKKRADSWQTIARPSITVPITHEGRASSFSRWLGAQALAGVAAAEAARPSSRHGADTGRRTT